MKLSVSLPDEDVAFLDEYARIQRMPSRSAVVHKAVRLLRAEELSAHYAEAWDEWTAEGDADLWETTAADGVT